MEQRQWDGSIPSDLTRGQSTATDLTGTVGSPVSRTGSTRQSVAASVRRLAVVAGYGFVVGILFVAILFSPLLFAGFDKSDEWVHFSNVGQAYGGISAVLSGLALCGVVASLLLQRRQARVERIAVERQAHFDIFKLALEDQALLDAVAPAGDSGPTSREQLYVNMVVGYWCRTWLMGDLGEDELRQNLARLFSGRAGYTYWARVRSVWNVAGTTKKRRFVAIVNSEWDALPPPLDIDCASV